MLTLQEAPAGIAAPAMLVIRFDLAHPPPASASPDDIVITGRRRYLRLPPLPDLHEDLLPRAETGFLGGTAGIGVEAKPLLGGVTSNRIMLTWKTKF